MANAHSFDFEVVARQSGSMARAGLLQTPHGAIETPIFMPVGTSATVKTVTPVDLEACGAQIVLANTYHLAIRPGADVVERLGGLHQFMAWPRPILTDSGGFQVFSLANRSRGRPLVRIDDDGVSFRSHVDGSLWRFTPEIAIHLQRQLGADVIMAFDECVPIEADELTTREATERTHRWARRCRDAWLAEQQSGGSPQALFGIIQGGSFRHLRRASAKAIAALDLPGIAVGGEAIGYSKDLTPRILDWIADLLPDGRPHYTMGVGDPVDFFTVVERGIDMFDSVLPTRLARNGTAFTSSGRLRLLNAPYVADERPIDVECGCPTCRRYSRAYLRFLFKQGELLAHHLTTIHNLWYCLNLTSGIRRSIVENRFDRFREEWAARQRV